MLTAPLPHRCEYSAVGFELRGDGWAELTGGGVVRGRLLGHTGAAGAVAGGAPDPAIRPILTYGRREKETLREFWCPEQWFIHSQ